MQREAEAREQKRREKREKSSREKREEKGNFGAREKTLAPLLSLARVQTSGPGTAARPRTHAPCSPGSPVPTGRCDARQGKRGRTLGRVNWAHGRVSRIPVRVVNRDSKSGPRDVIASGGRAAAAIRNPLRLRPRRTRGVQWRRLAAVLRTEGAGKSGAGPPLPCSAIRAESSFSISFSFPLCARCAA